MIRKRVATDGAYGFTMVEMAIVMLIIVIVATVIIPPTLKLGSTSRLRSGGMSAYSFIRGARSAAISEGLTLHVRYLNGATGPMLEAIHVNPAQASRLIAPDFNDPVNKRLDSILIDPNLRWNAEGFLYFRPDGSTLSNMVTLRLVKQNDSAKYVEITVFPSSGMVEMNRINDE